MPMGASNSSHVRFFRWGCLILLALYALLLVWYFPWRKHLDALEIEFTCELPEYTVPTMIFAAPSGWIYMNCGDKILCYLPPEERGGEGRLESFGEGTGSVLCMAMEEDVLYSCWRQNTSRQDADFTLVRMDAPPQPAWERLLEQDWQIPEEPGTVSSPAYQHMQAANGPAPVDVAANAEAVYVLDEVGRLACFDTGDGEPRWRIELLPTPPSGQTGAQQPVYYSGARTLLALDAEGTAYAQLNNAALIAVSNTGEALWETALPTQTAVSLQLAENLGRVYVLEDNGGVAVLDCADGAMLWQMQSQSYSGQLGIVGLPCVGEDGSVVMPDVNYAFMLVYDGGTKQHQLTQQYSYNSEVVRLADGGLLTLGNGTISAMDNAGKLTWSYQLGGSIFFGTPSYYDSSLVLASDGLIAVVYDEKLLGIRPCNHTFAPAHP